MTNCKGIFGKWFGHYFVSKIVEYTVSNVPIEVRGDITGILNSLADKKFKIICKRCGLEK